VSWQRDSVAARSFPAARLSRPASLAPAAARAVAPRAHLRRFVHDDRRKIVQRRSFGAARGDPATCCSTID